MTSKKVKLSGLFIGCLMVLSAMYMVMPASAKNTTTTSQKGLTIDAATATSFSFDNDTKTVTFNVTIPAMTAVNITVFNNNGTKLHWQFSVPIEEKLHKIVISKTTCVPQIPFVGSGIDVGTGMYEPTNASYVYLAIDQVTLTICITVTGRYNDFTSGNDGAYQLTGGSIQIKKTADLSAVADPATTTMVKNLTANKIASGGIVAQKIAVTADGWYLFKLNASRTTEAANTLSANIIELGTLDPIGFVGNQFTSYGLSQQMFGKVMSVGAISQTTQTANHYFAYSTAYLQSGKEYLVYVNSIDTVTGNMDLSWSGLVPAIGSLNDTGVAVNFGAADLSVVRTGSSTYRAYVDYGSLFDMETLYDLSLSAPGSYDIYASANVLGASLTGMPVNMAQSGQLFVIDDKISSDISIMNTPVLPTRGIISNSMQQLDSPLGDLNASAPIWNVGTIGASIVTHQLASVTITNGTEITTMPTTTLIAKESATSIPAFPVDGKVFSKSNNGGADDMGLYKLSGMAGKELDLTFSGLSGLINPTYTMQFLSESDLSLNPFFSTTGVITAGGGNTITVSNTTATWGGANPSWDTARVREVAVFTDPVYVLVTGSWPTTPNLTNSSSVQMNVTTQAFLNNKDSFVVSRDNQLQVYVASIGPCTQAVIESPYGQCCQINEDAKVRAKSADTFTAFYGNSLSLSNIQTVWSYCTSVNGYLVINGFNALDGTILKVTMTKVSSIPGFSIFFTILASFGIVAALIWKRRR